MTDPTTDNNAADDRCWDKQQNKCETSATATTAEEESSTSGSGDNKEESISDDTSKTNSMVDEDDDSCHLSLFYQHHGSGKPMADRSQTIAVAKALMGQASLSVARTLTSNDDNDNNNNNDVLLQVQSQQRPSVTNVYGEGSLLLSDIPTSCRRSNNANDKVVIGIDEAGRGSVMGPMVYGAAYWNLSDYESSKTGKNSGCCWTDSKKLTDTKRYDIMDNTILPTPEIGFACRIIHANEISRNMTRTLPYNLNQMSHDAAITIIHKLIKGGVTNIDTCYIDTVGIAEHYQRKLEQEFSSYNIKFVVESKADDKYAPCSAASIVAKVFRDRIIGNWKFSENCNNEYDSILCTNMKYGSGYPSDPVCKQWMQDNIQPVFGYTDLVRFSWKPTKKLLEEHAVPVTFAADLDKDDDDDEDAGMNLNVMKNQQRQMQAFLNGSSNNKNKNSNNKRRNLPFFKRRRLATVTKL